MKKISIVLTSIILFAACATQNRPVVNELYKPIKVEEVSSKKSLESEPEVIAADLKNYKINFEHYPADGQNNRIRFLVLHYTATDMKNSAYILTKKEVSSHYLVSDSSDSDIHLLVSEDKRAWHAGYSYWQGRENLNDTSIGIEIVNDGYTGDFNFIPFPKHQIEKVGALALDIVRRNEICATCVVGHSDIAPQRKYDPGPLFPWEELYYRFGIGAWPDKKDVRHFIYEYFTIDNQSASFIKQFQSDLNKYGYEITADGVWGKQSERVVRAFQYHFRPSNYDGKIDAETYAILQALLKKYFSK